MPEGVTLLQATEFFRERNPAGMTTKTVAEVVEAFIADRRAGGCSEVHLRDLGVRLGRFKEAFHLIPINSLSAPQVQEYLYTLTHGHTGQASANRNKENTLRQIVSLFNFARRMKFIPAELALEVAEIPTPKKQASAIELFTAAEIAAMLAEADEVIVPALAIAAFGGLRLAEVARLDWREVKLSEGVLIVSAGNAKTRARRVVPVSANLAEWLKPHAKLFGPVKPCADDDNKGSDYTYTVGSRLKARQWARTGTGGNHLTTTYKDGFDDATSSNSYGDLTEAAYSNDPESTPTIAYTYDRLGQMATVVNSVQTTTFTYNGPGQPATEAYSGSGHPLNNWAMEITPDSFYRRSRFEYKLSGTPKIGTDFTYDAAGRLSAIVPGPGWVTFDYLPNSSLIEKGTVGNPACESRLG